MKIYLAGKISKNCWRHDIVTGLRESLLGAQPAKHGGMDPEDWSPLPQSIFGTHDYVGPFFVSCDHGCFHGDSSHGVGAGNNTSAWLCTTWPVGEETTIQQCLKAVKSSDLVFAWVDTFDCFGTIAELGWAVALGIPTVVASPHHFDEPDMWFPIGMCRHNVRADSARDALVQFLIAHQEEIESISQITKSQQEWQARAISEYLNGECRLSLRVCQIASDVEAMAARGSASWRELLSYAVVKPLREAVGMKGK